MLAARGVPSHLVEAGGDLRVGTAPPGRAGWQVAVRRDGGDTIVVVANAAIATSGSAEQHVTIDGRRYSHIIDPRTGVGVQHLRQVTVIAASGADADGLATALVILGDRDGSRLIRRYPGARVFRDR